MAYSRSTIEHVSVILDTNNHRRDLERCLESIREQRYPSWQAVVVDNHSVDGTGSMIREKYPWVDLVRLEEDHGIGALNRGAQEAEGDLFVFLESESRFPRHDTLTRIVDLFRADSDLGAAGFRLIDQHDRPIEWFQWTREGSLREGFKSPTFPRAGAAIRPELFERAGGFWEPYFAYLGARDLATRVIGSGAQVRYFPHLSIRRRESHSERHQQREQYHLIRNTVWYIGRNFGVWRGTWKLIGHLVGSGLRALNRKGGFVAYLRALWDARHQLGEVLRTRKPVDARHLPWVEGRFSSGGS